MRIYFVLSSLIRTFAGEHSSNDYNMEARTINVAVNVPKSYSVDLLQKQLTAYAQQLIATARPVRKSKHHYRHEALCGIFTSNATEEQLVEEYLQDKYNL